MKTTITVALIGLSMLMMPTTFAGDVTGLTNYVAGTPARAADVNANFTAVKTAVDNNHARIIALEAANALLKTDNTTLNARLAALEAKLASVSVVSLNNQPTVRFEGVNVQIVNGLTTTNSVNGTGNLIVGYNEIRTSGTSTCSIGTTTVNFAAGTISIPNVDVTSCNAAGGTFALNHKTGSHNLVVGSQHNYSRAGGVVFGMANNVNGNFASVNGGANNSAAGEQASVSGGTSNIASGNFASVSGGTSNKASGTLSSVSGGTGNTASGGDSSVSGGSTNTASGFDSSVSGGRTNTASGGNSSVSGGVNNDANYFDSSVSGGNNNTAGGSAASVSGGANRSAAGVNSWAAGSLLQTN